MKRKEFVLLVCGRPRYYGPRWLCLRKAKGYSLATRPIVREVAP